MDLGVSDMLGWVGEARESARAGHCVVTDCQQSLSRLLFPEPMLSLDIQTYISSGSGGTQLRMRAAAPDEFDPN